MAEEDCWKPSTVNLMQCRSKEWNYLRKWINVRSGTCEIRAIIIMAIRQTAERLSSISLYEALQRKVHAACYSAWRVLCGWAWGENQSLLVVSQVDPGVTDHGKRYTMLAPLLVGRMNWHMVFFTDENCHLCSAWVTCKKSCSLSLEFRTWPSF